jgi:3-hydroxybutyrate dehydrogenase
MKRRREGRIINIASSHGLVASPNKCAYVASKHGIVGFTKATAVETAERGIRVNAICPGFVDTPLAQKQVRDRAQEAGISEERAAKEIVLAPHPTREFVRPEQIAAAALFLCGEGGAQMTGSCLTIDGGWTAR